MWFIIYGRLTIKRNHPKLWTKAQEETKSSFCEIVAELLWHLIQSKRDKTSIKVASNGKKAALPQQRSRGQSRQIETTIIVSDGGNENAQIVLNLPKSSTSTATVQQIVKAVTAPSTSTSVSQSTSGVMTGVKLISLDVLSLLFNLSSYNVT